MDEPVSAAEANRSFSRLLRAVREEQASFTITSHGTPVARLVPVEPEADARKAAWRALMERVRAQPAQNIPITWTRDELYER